MFIKNNLWKRFYYFFFLLFVSSAQAPSHGMQMLKNGAEYVRGSITYAAHSIYVMRHGPQTKADFYHAIYHHTHNNNLKIADIPYIRELKKFISSTQEESEEQEAVKKLKELLGHFQQDRELKNKEMNSYDIEDFKELYNYIKGYERHSSLSRAKDRVMEEDNELEGNIPSVETPQTAQISDNRSQYSQDEESSPALNGSYVKVTKDEEEKYGNEKKVETVSPTRIPTPNNVGDHVEEASNIGPDEQASGQVENGGWRTPLTIFITAVGSIVAIVRYKVHKNRLNDRKGRRA